MIVVKSKILFLSDSEDSTVTYTEVSSPFEDLSDIGSPGVDGLPMMPEDPYAYVVAAFQVPPSPDYVSGLREPEAGSNFHQSFRGAAHCLLLSHLLPTHQDYFTKFNPEEDPTDYLAKGGDDDNDDDESSDDDEDDDDDVEEDEDEEEEEEHPAPIDSVSPPVHRVTARMSVQTHILSPSDTDGCRSSAIPITISPLSSFHLHHYPIIELLMSQLRADDTIYFLLLHRQEVFSEVTLPPWKRLCIALGYDMRIVIGELLLRTVGPLDGFRADYGFIGTLDDEIRRDPERDVSYGITDTWDEMVDDMQGTPVATDVAETQPRG
ncbi:hypothetical protein Tco_0666007 [Tanacetum coccineum]